MVDKTVKKEASTEISQVDLDIWKKVVDVQMHFNDLELRVRNYAILSLGAILTVSGYSLKEGNLAEFGAFTVPSASVFLYVAIVVWLCFWYMDRHWYHRLLLGAVRQGMKIENRYSDSVEAINLSSAIKAESPHEFLGYEIRSQHRLNFFYWMIAFVLFELATFLWSVGFGFLFGLAFLLLFIIGFFVSMKKIR